MKWSKNLRFFMAMFDLKLHFTNIPLIETLKSGSHLPKKFCVICLIESPLKVMKNAFYFILKALFVFKIFKFLTFWSCRKNGFIRSISLTSKLMASQPGLQTIAIHI